MMVDYWNHEFPPKLSMWNVVSFFRHATPHYGEKMDSAMGHCRMHVRKRVTLTEMKL